jgi:excisionase family DNA binding protein
VLSLEQLVAAVVAELRKLVREEVRAANAEARPAGRPLTVAEYAAAHGISQSTVRRAIAERRLDVTRAGRAVRIAPDATIRARSAERDVRAPAANSAAAMDRALRILKGGA